MPNGSVVSSLPPFEHFPSSTSGAVTQDDLVRLDKHFCEHSYCSGAVPSAWDARLLSRVPPSPDLPNLRRWRKHLASFSQEELEELEREAMDVDSRVRNKERAFLVALVAVFFHVGLLLSCTLNMRREIP